MQSKLSARQKTAFERQIYDSAVRNPVDFASNLLAAAKRLSRKRSQWLKFKKRSIARSKKKKMPR